MPPSTGAGPLQAKDAETISASCQCVLERLGRAHGDTDRPGFRAVRGRLCSLPFTRISFCASHPRLGRQTVYVPDPDREYASSVSSNQAA
jgi:hypothetical protein